MTTWKQLDNWQTAVLFVLVAAVLYSPVWGGYLLHFLFHWKWALWMATAMLAFWAAPFTPFWPLCMGITLAIKKAFLALHDHVKKVIQRSARR